MRKLSTDDYPHHHDDDAMAAGLYPVDVAMFWAAESGGVKRYLRTKHDFLRPTH